MDLNVVCLSGRLTRDPELSMTNSGVPVLQFGMAVNDFKRNGDEWEQIPNFFDVVMFGDRCERLSNILEKGSHVMVTGKLRYSSWEKDGQKRSRVEVVARGIDAPKSEQPQQERREPVPEETQHYSPAISSPEPTTTATIENQSLRDAVNNAMESSNQAGLYDADIPF